MAFKVANTLVIYYINKKKGGITLLFPRLDMTKP